MVHNDKKLDELTHEILSNLDRDEPSEQFTARVMDSVHSLDLQSDKNRFRTIYWFIPVLPVLFAIFWGILRIPGIKELILKNLDYINQSFGLIGLFVRNLIKPFTTMSVSPLMLIICLSVFLFFLSELYLTYRRQHH
ncbi:MAG: hypothetical protein H6540_03165 [Bacteroidales bacterium]|nr:hypothetical protein [Bacteroidales bacterium]MCB9013852.1 hypothetical protein [Bacteroidales bacterium]